MQFQPPQRIHPVPAAGHPGWPASSGAELAQQPSAAYVNPNSAFRTRCSSSAFQKNQMCNGGLKRDIRQVGSDLEGMWMESGAAGAMNSHSGTSGAAVVEQCVSPVFKKLRREKPSSQISMEVDSFSRAIPANYDFPRGADRSPSTNVAAKNVAAGYNLASTTETSTSTTTTTVCMDHDQAHPLTPVPHLLTPLTPSGEQGPPISCTTTTPGGVVGTRVALDEAARQKLHERYQWELQKYRTQMATHEHGLTILRCDRFS